MPSFNYQRHRLQPLTSYSDVSLILYIITIIVITIIYVSFSDIAAFIHINFSVLIVSVVS